MDKMFARSVLHEPTYSNGKCLFCRMKEENHDFEMSKLYVKIKNRLCKHENKFWDGSCADCYKNFN